MSMDRRSMLKLSGAIAAAGTVGLAGCQNGKDNGDGTDTQGTQTQGTDTGSSGGGVLSAGQLPAYSKWVGVDSEDKAVAIYMNLQANESGQSSGQVSDKLKNDPMYGLPLTGGIVAAFSLFGLSQYGLSGLTGGTTTGGSSGSSSFESDAKEIVVTSNTLVLLGDMKKDELESAVTGTHQGFDGTISKSEELGEFTLYTADGSSTNAVAISENAIVTASSDKGDKTQMVKDTIAVARGNATRATDKYDEFATLLKLAGDGDIAFGGYGTGPNAAQQDSSNSRFPALQGIDGFVSSLTKGSGQEVSGKFAASGTADLNKDDVRSSLGASADESTVGFASGRVMATATWNNPTGSSSS